MRGLLQTLASSRCLRFFAASEELWNRLTSRAVIRNRSNRRPPVFAVQLDRLNNQIKGVHAVDLACHAIGTAWDGAKAFGEVKQTIDTTGVAIEHEQQRARGVFCPREQEQVIGAEVEHSGGRKTRQEREPQLPRPLSAPLRGYPTDSSGSGYRHSAAHVRGRLDYSAGGGGFWFALRRLSPPSRNTSEFATRRSAMAVAMVVL